MSACLPLTREAASRELAPAVVTVTDHAQLPAVPANADRRSVLIVNTDSTNTVYLVRNAQGQAGSDTAYPIKPGEGLTLATAAPIYLVAQTGVTAVVKVIAELGSV